MTDKKHFNEKLSAEDIERLKQFDNAINNTLYLSDGDAVDWHFDPTKFEQITNPKYPDSPQVNFRVWDGNLDGEFDAVLSMAAARQISPFLRKGVFFLHIERHGAGKDTKYEVSEVK